MIGTFGRGDKRRVSSSLSGVRAVGVMMLRPNVLLSDDASAPFGYGHHAGTVGELPYDAPPLSGLEPDRVGRDLGWVSCSLPWRFKPAPWFPLCAAVYQGHCARRKAPSGAPDSDWGSEQGVRPMDTVKAPRNGAGIDLGEAKVLAHPTIGERIVAVVRQKAQPRLLSWS